MQKSWRRMATSLHLSTSKEATFGVMIWGCITFNKVGTSHFVEGNTLTYWKTIFGQWLLAISHKTTCSRLYILSRRQCTYSSKSYGVPCKKQNQDVILASTVTRFKYY